MVAEVVAFAKQDMLVQGPSYVSEGVKNWHQ